MKTLKKGKMTAFRVYSEHCIHRLGLVASLVALCAATGIAKKNETLSFQVDGKTRSCFVHIPDGITNPALVFFVHGAGGSGEGFSNDTRGNTTADREKFIAAYPSASSNGGSGTWDDMFGTGNFPFFLAVIDTIDARYQIDRKRVYMTGFSQGGMISYVAGCSYSDVFAAVAPVSGHSGSSCTLKRPVPLFMTFGTKDFGDPSSFMADLDVWLKLDSCPADPEVTRPYPASNQQSVVTRLTYGPCAQGSYVVVDSVQGGGHGWPTDTRTSVNQADEVWEFFKQFSLDDPTPAVRRHGTTRTAPVAAVYASGSVRVTGAGERCRVQVIDTRGRTVAKENASSFLFSDKPAGVYMLRVNGNAGSAVVKMIVP